MAVRIDLTLDCANPTRLAEFWKLALGYEDEPPPAPFTSREEWLAQFDPDEDDTGTGPGCATRPGSALGCRCSRYRSRRWPRTGSTWTCG